MNPLYPFSGATIFISHRCADHEISHVINDYFKYKKQNTFYSCDGDATPNKYVIPLQELRNSDVFLFLVSNSSLQEDCFAWAEYKEAEAMEKRKELIVVRCLIEKKAPFKRIMGSDVIVESFDVESLDSSCEKLLKFIHRKIISDFSLVKIKNICSAHSYYYNDISTLLINRLFDNGIMDGGYKKPFYLNFILRAIETAKIIKNVTTLSEKEKNHFINFLKNIILYADHDYNVAKQNAIYLLGKLEGNNEVLAKEILKRMPEQTNRFYYRGFCIGISYLSQISVMEHYVRNLRKNDNDCEWRKQRELNILYHRQYYHSNVGVIHQLRQSLTNVKKCNLFTLNLFTLSEFSCDLEDIDFIDNQKQFFYDHGIENSFIEYAKDIIYKKKMDLT